MKSLLGIVNNNIAYVMSLLMEYKTKEKSDLKVQVLAFSDEKPKAKADVILVATTSTFMRHKEALEATNAVVFVFDSAPLAYGLKPIELLDVAELRDGYRFLYRPLSYHDLATKLGTALKSKGKVTVKRETLDMIPALLSQVKGSVVGPIMGYIYKLKKTDDREHILGLILSWFISDEPFTSLVNTLAKEQRFTKKPKALDDLQAFFESVHGKSGRSAIQFIIKRKVGGKQINYKKVSKQYNIDPFDLKYALTLFRRNKTFRRVNRTLRELFDERKTEKAMKPEVIE